MIDLNNNTLELKKIGATTALRMLPTGHVAHKLTEFASGGWKAPTPEQTKLFQARSDVFRPVTLPGESKHRRQYQIADFSSGLAYTVSNHSQVSPRSNICACDRCGDDQPTGDCSSGAVLTHKPSTCERSFASGFDVDANSEMGKSHIDRRVSVATTYPAMPRSCHSGSMASRHRHVARGILPNRANRVHTSTGTQSMGINGRMRQKTRRTWRHPQLFPYSYSVCTEEREDQRESREERQCQHQSKSCTDRQWSVGRKREGQRLSKVQPRALCVPDCRRTDRALSRMGPHWDAVYIDHGVSRRGRQFQRENTNRTKDGDSATGSGGLSAGPHAGLKTSTSPGQDGGSPNPTLSNDWTAQMQVLMSNPELAQEQFAQWQLIHQHFQHLQYQQ